jgi:NADH-quinone oxidoreductase subunit A
MQQLGTQGIISIAVFFGVLVLGLVYAWRKGALEWK